MNQFVIESLHLNDFEDVYIPTNSSLFQKLGFSNPLPNSSTSNPFDFSNPVNALEGLDKISTTQLTLDQLHLEKKLADEAKAAASKAEADRIAKVAKEAAEKAAAAAAGTVSIA